MKLCGLIVAIALKSSSRILSNRNTVFNFLKASSMSNVRSCSFTVGIRARKTYLRWRTTLENQD